MGLMLGGELIKGTHMGYVNFIQNQISIAFNTIGDLATDLTFVQTTPASFDFNNSITVTTPLVSTTIKGIINKKKRENTSNTMFMNMSFRSSDIPDATIYDKVIINGITWNVTPPYVEDNGLTTFDVSKEG
jgi:hypothetical protein